MTLKPGTWLNHYEVLDHLGTGGMGEVYRARDNKLQREVALKVLPKAFAQDPERLARFRREAQVLAQLNHTNIAAIYSVEESGGTHFLVMELALGETLKDRIKRGSREWGVGSGEAQVGTGTSPRHTNRAVATDGTSGIPLDEALDICKQIAAGLECAHEKPIVHRDLKPANVKVTPEGVVKILDFGLARAFQEETGSGDPADSPTLTGMTAPGTILGTAAYMSPEQARGKTVDKRTDIWALGCVLFEMLTGKHAFEGDDMQEILAGVMKGEPDWAALPETTPHPIRLLLRRCLEKDAKRRLSSAADLQIQMEEALSASATGTPTAVRAASPPPVWRRALPWGVAVMLAAVVGVAAWTLRPVPAAPVTRVTVSLPVNETLALRTSYTPCPTMALSPDGNLLAYVAIREGRDQLYLRALDSFETTVVSGVERQADSLFFSPDGQWLGFWADGGLKKVATSGGAPITLVNATDICGGSWGEDDSIIFSRARAGLQRISADGGDPEVLTELDEGESRHVWPEVLPGGKAVLFTVRMQADFSDDGDQIVVRRLDTGERKVLVQGGSHGRYVATGHLLYLRAGTLLAVPFDLNRLEVTGRPVTLMEGVMRATTGASIAVSRTGTLIFVSGDAQEARLRALVWVDRKGSVQPLGASPGAYGHPQLSPDGRQLAVTVEAPKNDIWVYDIARSTLTRLTFEGNNSRPLWTPDGQRIAFRSDKLGPRNLFWKLADGTGSEEQITKLDKFTDSNPGSFAPDGKLAFYYANDPRTNRDIWTVPLEGEYKASVFLQTPFDEQTPRISPDGHWLAYVSNESGRNEIYVRSFPGPGGKWQISTEGGTQPLWARNGREFFYRNGDKVMAVDITTQPSFQAGTPEMLFEGQYESRASETNFDVSPDGQRFLMIKPSEQQPQAPRQIHVVLNWFEELKRRVPVP